jgi:hypothetical protein
LRSCCADDSGTTAICTLACPLIVVRRLFAYGGVHAVMREPVCACAVCNCSGLCSRYYCWSMVASTNCRILARVGSVRGKGGDLYERSTSENCATTKRLQNTSARTATRGTAIVASTATLHLLARTFQCLGIESRQGTIFCEPIGVGESMITHDNI